LRIKDAIIGIAKRTGGLALVRDSGWRRRRLLILCYHGVSLHDEHEWNPSLYVTQEKFRRRLRALRDGGYRILPLVEATRRLYDGTLPPRAVAITFDDGAIDFVRRALPVLREFDAPATLYLTTYYCETRLPVFDTALSYVLWKGRDSGADLGTLCDAEGSLPVRTEEERGRAWKTFYDFAARRGLGAVEKNALVRRVAQALGVDYDAIVARGQLQIMTPEEVRELPRDLVDVQLHTHRHRTPRDEALFTREIDDNAERIRALRGDATPLEHFCYPLGEYFGEFCEWLRRRGVRYATTCVPGLAASTGDPLLLPRLVDSMTQSDLIFEAWASGFAELLPRRSEFHLDPERLAERDGRAPTGGPQVPGGDEAEARHPRFTT
jgi:peptidoglycan/xylan/chitin deacetylase (PgdA/CDA1 family)